jgi:predicted nuclease of predicted toxin-antitoxin system
MRFLVDECAGPSLARWLQEQGHDVFSVFDQARGFNDEEVLRIALENELILITVDKDFGEKIFREKRAHHGVILLRLKDERSKNKIAAMKRLLTSFATRIRGQFVVVTDTQVRFSSQEDMDIHSQAEH